MLRIESMWHSNIEWSICDSDFYRIVQEEPTFRVIATPLDPTGAFMNAIELQTSLKNAHVVIIGGSTGIGLATAEHAKAQGAVVTLVGRNLAKLEQAATSLDGARIAVADVAKRAELEAVFAGMERVDHLVITAGGFIAGKLADSDPDVLLHAVQERIAGPLYAIKAALPLMPQNGSITLTGGQLSDRPAANGSAVISAAVRGVEGLARALALELQPIRVNVISPGFVDTPLFDAFGVDGKTAVLGQAAAQLPVKRVGRPAEVARAIGFLMSNGYMSGEVLHIDGGGRLV
jgi:NAD(P)-dependent dehydrogenase (short-subunit alcohol dehydrogenase family)